MELVQIIKATIDENQLDNWLIEFPWLTGHIGNPRSALWFVGENPSLTAVRNVDKRSSEKSENLQWNSHDGDRLLREAITEAGLKSGRVEINENWNCYITNAIKEPAIVAERNENKTNSQYWKEQAEHWFPAFQSQIDYGDPKALIALGGESEKILKYMIKIGLKVPALEKIHHYSYIMMRPETGTRRGPRHPDRIKEFKVSVKLIAEKYSA